LYLFMWVMGREKKINFFFFFVGGGGGGSIMLLTVEYIAEEYT